MSWPVVPLEALQADEPRAITDGPFGSNLARRHYTDAGPRVVRLQNIGDGRFVDNPAHIAEEHFSLLRAHEVRPGDLLVASLGEVLPRACLAPEWLGPAIVKADCIRVRLGDKVDPRWVLYAMERPAARRWADDHRHGVGRPRLGLKVIRQIPVPLPPIDEQRRIIDLLDDHLSRLDAAARDLLTASRRIKMLESSLLEQNFAGGELVPLDNLVGDISAGKSFGTANAPAGEDEWGIIRVSAMTWGEFKADENKAVSSGKVDPRFEIRTGDLLVSRANTADYVGASVLVGHVRPKLLLSDKSLRITPSDGVDPKWLWRALQAPSARRQITELATGTKDSMRNISQASLRRVMLPRHDASMQLDALSAYEDVSSSAEALRRELVRSEGRLVQLRRSLLTAAFSGRLTCDRLGLETDELVTL